MQQDTKVLDSRESGSFEIRRRRECLSCNKRFTTYEKTDASALTVVKRDDTTEPFTTEKVRAGLIRACKKRDVSEDAVEKAVDELEAEIRFEAEDGEITSERIGELTMQKLKTLDPIAYIRFASVYKEFDTPDAFKHELEQLQAEQLTPAQS